MRILPEHFLYNSTAIWQRALVIEVWKTILANHSVQLRLRLSLDVGVDDHGHDETRE